MNGFTRILFQVDPLYSDFTPINSQQTIPANGMLVLSNLVPLRQIWVEIMLPRKGASTLD
jgi:hypothetical protein